jgi:hypothetical protein
MGRGRYERIAVFLDLNKPLISRIDDRVQIVERSVTPQAETTQVSSVERTDSAARDTEEAGYGPWKLV